MGYPNCYGHFPCSALLPIWLVSSLVHNSFPGYGLIAQGRQVGPVQTVIAVEKEQWLAFEDTSTTRYVSVYEQRILVIAGTFIAVENAMKLNYVSSQARTSF